MKQISLLLVLFLLASCKETGFESGKVNTVIAMTRWICVVYDDSDEDNGVYEMGLVENPYKG